MKATFIIPILALLAGAVAAQLPSIEERTEGLVKHEGYVTFWWDAGAGKLWAEFRPGEQLIYVYSLATGLGSNPVGLDRKQLGGTRLVALRRVGPKLLLVQPNLKFRALSDDAAERNAVTESFAESVLFGFKIEAESGARVLVDATDFVVRDAQGIARKLKSDGGTWKLDKTRSSTWIDGCKGFPRNTELEALLTFTGEGAGSNVRRVAPTSSAVTLRQRHSFVKLPPDGYRSRAFDPRAPSSGPSFQDYAAPLDGDMEVRWIGRHRLEKTDPSAAVSEAKEPIVYYVDRGVPEPVRSALVEGASWWDEAFEAAGFKDAFRVEVMPEGADPLDVRYNVINWVHRSTRGWSYGSSVSDPRTGEIIKGHVLLGSLRVRQDRLIFEGMTPGQGGCCGASGPPGSGALGFADPKTEPVETALARVRQLSAHEVGHTLGFAHNFAASVNGRASVMDYPAPKVLIREDGSLDLSDAYDVGIGEWDKYSVRYAYTEFGPGVSEEAGLDAIVQEWLTAGMHFASDQDARSLGTAHALAHLWDNGSDPVAELAHALEVRRVAMDRLSESALPEGTPVAALEETVVPVYLHHRYQLEAAAKLIGGYHYTYALRGDGQVPQRPVLAARQRLALEKVLSCLRPEALTLPGKLLDVLPPAPFGGRGDRERFPRRTGAIFDPMAVAETAADLALKALLHPQRATRLAMAASLDSGGLGLVEVLNALVLRTWGKAPSQDTYEAGIERVVERRVLDQLMGLASSTGASPTVRAQVTGRLRSLHAELASADQVAEAVERSHRLLARDDIRRFLDRPWDQRQPTRSVEAPPGSPIGR